jgi:hypothetical protein
MNPTRYLSHVGFVIGLLLAGAPLAWAHDFLTGFIQHRADLTLGAKHIDVTLRLTFFEDGSEHERRHIDTNGDGRVSRQEASAYVEKLEQTLGDEVTLDVDGRSVSLMTLYPPELDLLGNNRVGRERHVLTLYLFGTTPSPLRADSAICVKETLWTEFRAITSLDVIGKDGAQLKACPVVSRSAESRQPLSFTARVVKPPIQGHVSIEKKP